jgi:integrase/recombinase XerD
MAFKEPTGNLFLDTNYKHQDGKYPVKITVYYLGKKRRRGIPFSFTQEEWDKIHSKKLRNQKLKDEKIKLDYWVGKKFKAAKEDVGEPFSFERFFEIYFRKDSSQLENQNVYDMFDRYIAELDKNGQHGTATVYRSSRNSFQKFRKRLNFAQVNVKFCETYEKDMEKQGRAVSYIAMNLRNLRTIYNLAIRDKIALRDNYPFSQSQNDGKYQIPAAENVKKALTLKELVALKAYEPKTPAQRKAYLFWWFSYYANGINVKDLCQLQWKHVDGEIIAITRAKTARTQRVRKLIQFYLSPEIQAIIDELGNDDKSPDAYIFRVLKHGMTPKQVRDTVQSFTHTINQRLQVIKKDLELNKPLTTMVARHTFSTHLNRNGVPVGITSAQLGHTSEETTHNYLDSFKIDTLKYVAAVLRKIEADENSDL